MQENLKEIESTGGRVVAISYDSEETLERYARSGNIRFPLLSDKGSKTIDAYGIRNKEASGSKIDGVPYPGTFIIDKKGNIRSKLFLEGYRDRHAVKVLVKAFNEAK